MSEVQGAHSVDASGSPEAKQRWLTPRGSAILSSALLVLVIAPLPWTGWAALLAAPTFVYVLVSLPAGHERTVALLSSGLAALVPATFLLLLA
jgi:hypothetical protein